MRTDYVPTPHVLLAQASLGPWPVPRLLPNHAGGQGVWQLLGRDGKAVLGQVSQGDAVLAIADRTNTCLMASARSMFSTLVWMVNCGKATPASQLVAEARKELNQVAECLRAMQEVS